MTTILCNFYSNKELTTWCLWLAERTISSMAISAVNFINVLRTAFTLVDPKRVKRHCWLYCIFYTFGIYEHKIERWWNWHLVFKILKKINKCGQFLTCLRAAFTLASDAKSAKKAVKSPVSFLHFWDLRERQWNWHLINLFGTFKSS